MSTILENPSDQLSTIVVRLFELAGDTRIKPKSKRDKIFLAAHKLHGYSMTLAQKRFMETSAQYKKAMDNIREVNSGLKQARYDIEEIVQTVKEVGKLVSDVEKLLITVADSVG
jgi:DNA-binding transcriptional regulator GbsR (MarR family)